MKRVKIMLSAVLVMAVVAGALAFKAKKAERVCVYQFTAAESCPKVAYNFTVTTPTITGDPTTVFVTTLSAASEAACPTTTVCTNTVKTITEL